MSQAGKLRSVPEVRLVSFTFSPARVAPERQLIVRARRHAPDDAAAGRVCRDVELIQRGSFDAARRIDRTECAAELAKLPVSAQLQLRFLCGKFLCQHRAQVVSRRLVMGEGGAVSAFVFEVASSKTKRTVRADLPFGATVDEVRIRSRI